MGETDVFSSFVQEDVPRESVEFPDYQLIRLCRHTALCHAQAVIHNAGVSRSMQCIWPGYSCSPDALQRN